MTFVMGFSVQTVTNRELWSNIFYHPPFIHFSMTKSGCPSVHPLEAQSPKLLFSLGRWPSAGPGCRSCGPSISGDLRPPLPRWGPGSSSRGPCLSRAWTRRSPEVSAHLHRAVTLRASLGSSSPVLEVMLQGCGAKPRPLGYILPLSWRWWRCCQPVPKTKS